MATPEARINGSLVCLFCSVCKLLLKELARKKINNVQLIIQNLQKIHHLEDIATLSPNQMAEKRLSLCNTRTTYKTQNPGHMLFFPRHVGIKSIAEAIGRKEARIGLGPIPELFSCETFATVEFCRFGKCALANFASWLNNQSKEAYITWGCAY